MQIPADKIGFLIGPGGKNIKAMQEQYKVKSRSSTTRATSRSSALDSAKVKACIDAIQAMTETPKIGTR